VKIDDTGLPDFDSCRELDTARALACQDEQVRIMNKVDEYNKIVKGCQGPQSKDTSIASHKSSPSGSAVETSPNKSSGTRPEIDYAAAARAIARRDFDLAEKMNSKEGWRAFLKDHPDGLDAEYAKKKLKELEGDTSTSLPEQDRRAAVATPYQLKSAVLQLTQQINTRQDQYFDGRLTQSKSVSNTNGFEMSVTVGADELRAVHSELGFKCGRDRPLSTTATLKGQDTVYRCSYSQDGDLYSMDWTQQYRSSNGGGGTNLKARVRFSISGNQCKVLGGSANMVTGPTKTSPISIKKTSDISLSGSCRLK